MRRLIGPLLIAVSLLAAAAALRGAPAPLTVRIRALEFAYEPREITVRPGEILFMIENVGAIEHNFLIEDASHKTLAKVAVIAPGVSEQVRITLRPGTYGMYCDLPGHKDAGMTAAVRVQE